MKNLYLHAGANAATLDEVRAAPTPAPEGSHYPIPHSALIDATLRYLELAGWEQASSEWGLFGSPAMPQARLFGVMKVRPRPEAVGTELMPVPVQDLAPATQAGHGLVNSTYQLAIGLRNSHDKTFAASLAIGSSVFVCDNLAFSGELVVARKHTRFIADDLDRLVGKTVERIPAQAKWMQTRLDSYMKTPLDARAAHDAVIQALDLDIIGAQRVPRVLAAWRDPEHEAFRPRNVWSLFNAFTHVLKEVNPEGLTGRTIRLHSLMDRITGIVAPGAQIDLIQPETAIQEAEVVPN